MLHTDTNCPFWERDHPALSGTPPKEGNYFASQNVSHNSPPSEGWHFAKQNDGVVALGKRNDNFIPASRLKCGAGMEFPWNRNVFEREP
jgi:hypothetical protein